MSNDERDEDIYQAQPIVPYPEETVEAESEEPTPSPEQPQPMSESDREAEEWREHMFGVPEPEDHDMRTADLVTLEGEDDISDLLDVDFDRDIIGEEPSEEPAEKKRFRIVPKGRRFTRRPAPPTSLGGLQQ